MTLALYATVRAGNHPGHIVVGQEPADGAPRYFGFRFDVEDLPDALKEPSEWRNYLFENAVPGLIEDETAQTLFQLEALRTGQIRILGKRVAHDVRLLTVLPPSEVWKPHARYSFNPDDFHTESQPCYNCVTWATKVANALVPGTLTPVRQGRVKLIVLQLREITASEVGVDG